mmetsp:Transcript_19637/g.32189  ORF Transcript_19637/g.32189 Transcript_19637/m.32189 type:complete len:202 (+) Transcript_19637:230-835(+)
MILKPLSFLGILQVESIAIGVFENLSAFHELFISCFEKFHICPDGIGVLFLQQDHSCLSLFQSLLCKVLCARVTMIAFVVVKVAVQLSLCLGGIGLIVLIAGIEFIALVIPTGIGTMLRPVAHADPAEFIPTARARHVVAALVLLDTRGTLWAWFGIRKDPVGRLRLISALLLPHGKIFACHGSVGLLSTLETETSIALVT